MYAVINRQRALAISAASVLWAVFGRSSFAVESIAPLHGAYPETAQSGPLQSQGEFSTIAVGTSADVSGDAAEVVPSQLVLPPDNGVVSPLVDEGDIEDNPTMLGDTIGEKYEPQRRGVRPYGGGHPDDWPWGCGCYGNFRTGPGMCDTWRVGPIWNVAVDGMVLRRGATDIGQIANETNLFPPNVVPLAPELLEPFEYAPGGRVSLIGKYPWCAGYRVHAGYEGIEAWEASIIYPKQTLDVDSVFTQQRRVHYRSNLHSGELNIIKCQNNVWQPYCGVRYIKFDDELRIFDDQEAASPLPGPMPDTVTTTDMTNLFDLENNLMGFQVGLRSDVWRLNSRFALEGFINGGVYYNKIKYTNLMNTTIRQQTADDPTTEDFEFSDFTVASQNIATSDVSEIAYVGEASLSGVFRINKCWAMRAGYQALWMNGLRLADDAFLDPDTFLDNESRSMFFHGWHAGIECRR